MYRHFFKRILDIICSLLALSVFGWLYVIIAVLVKIKMGSPVLFRQVRPGKNEKLFTMYKFRTMTDKTDENGLLLPDEKRLTKFGTWLRSTSLDELPEVFNILKGDMSVIGPRPLLVRDMVFMTSEQRKRHIVSPGLSGLAQISGRNALEWKKKLNLDVEYVSKVSFFFDLAIVFKTIGVFLKRSDITEEGMATAQDYGDYLLSCGEIIEEEYEKKQAEAVMLINRGRK